jgi:hypothetical protein
VSRVAVRATWWALLVLSVGGSLVAIPHSDNLQNQSFVVPQLACTAVGAFIAWRRPRNPVGWVLLSGGAMAGLVGMGNALSIAAYVEAPLPGQPVPWWGVVGAWLYSWLWFPLFWTLTGLLFLVYPDGLPSRRWRPVLGASVVAVAVVALTSALYPTLTLGDDNSSAHRTILNPVGLGDASGPLWSADATLTAIATGIGGLLIVVSAASLVVRSRHASPIVRLQLRWFGFAAAVFVAVFAMQVVLGSSVGGVSDLLFSLSVASLPIACGIAIMRYRLYDIDRAISRTASYALVTACVLGVYVAIVTSASALVGSQSTLVVAGATLAAAALFRPLLHRVQGAVDRRFNREKVDGQRAVDAFGASLVDEVDPKHARAQLVSVTHTVLAPASVALWTAGRFDD